MIRVGKVKDGSQVTDDGTSPRRNIRLKHSETLFDELDQRRVIEQLGIDKASLAPRRDRKERHPRTQADRAGRETLRLAVCLHDLVFDTDGRGSEGRMSEAEWVKLCGPNSHRPHRR